MSTIKTRLVAIGAAVALGAGLVSVTAPPTGAASVSIGSVSRTNASDVKSKGVIKTPTTKTSGVQVASRSYVIYKGKTKIATTGTQGRSYSVKPGTYTVKSSMKYRTVTTRETAVTKWAWSDEVPPSAMSWGEITPNTDGAEARRVSGFYPYEDSADYREFQAEVRHKDGQKSIVWIAVWTGPEDESDTYRRNIEKAEKDWPMDEWGSDHNDGDYSGSRTERYYAQFEIVTTTKVYGAWKTVAKSQTVKVGNSGVMTFYEYKKVKDKAKLSTVKKIVGGSGKVVDRYSYGKHEYVTRDFNGHYVYFDNCKVYAKYW